MRLEVYLKKKIVFIIPIIAVSMLLTGIFLETVTLIIVGIFLSLVSILILKTYLFKPAIVFERKSFHFQGIYGKNVQYDFDKIEDISYDEERKELSIKYKPTQATHVINNSYNVTPKEIYETIQSNMNRG